MVSKLLELHDDLLAGDTGRKVNGIGAVLVCRSGARCWAPSMSSAPSPMRIPSPPPFQKLVTEWCWGEVWGRPGLDRKTRSIVNLAMLTALNRANELKLHVRGALNNGLSREEIQEVLLQTTIYCGVPAALEAFRSAVEVFKEEDSKTP